MDEDTASKFVSSLVKSIQSLCNGYIEFASSIEVIGHIHVNIDRNLKFNYVLSEEVNKSRSEAATVFSSHSYHSKPPPSAAPSKPASAQSDTDRSHQKSHGSRPDDVDPRVPSQLNFSPASRDSFTSGRSDEDGVQTTSSRSRESESSRSPATHTQDSLDRRRKMRSETRTSGNSEPVLKRSRPSGPSSVTFPKEEYEVIEVKEEPDDDDSACLYGNNKSGQSGRGMQDISQPDFSNLVAESLDRVGQHEGAPLMGGNMQHLGEEPFPVTLLHNQAAGQAAPVGLSPGDPQASTSGGFQVLPEDVLVGYGADYRPSSRDNLQGLGRLDRAQSTQGRKKNKQGDSPGKKTGKPTFPSHSDVSSDSQSTGHFLPATESPGRALKSRFKISEPAGNPPRELLEAGHVLERIPPAENAKRKARKACKLCYNNMRDSGATRLELKNQRPMTNYQCKICRVPLCANPCFTLYHGQVPDQP